MIRNWCFVGIVLGFTALLAVSSSPFQDDFSDIRGSYCENIGCCNERQDSCSVPILGTLCYCDDFCNYTRVDDCCPDYWSHCRGILPPPTTTPEITTDEVGEFTSCTFQDRTIFEKQKVRDNCNECICEQGELFCETNVCLIDPNVTSIINRNPELFGWTSANYSEFWGRTLDDGVTLRLGTVPPQQSVMKMNPVRIIYNPAALPREFDSDAVWPGYITGIQDQGWCGSSWAISTAAIASDRYAIVSRGKEAVQLSAQNLISCDTRGQQSCTGGHLDRAWSFIKAYGLVDEECFPYVARNEKCSIGRQGSLLQSGCRAPKYGSRKRRYSVGPAYRLGNETDIMNEIMRSGPVQVTMKVYQDFFTYSGGIYKHTDLTLNRRHGYHSVRIIGWGEEVIYNGVQKYWKVANSWGRNWGEDGYFRIARGTNECEIESFVIASWPQVERKVLLSNQVPGST